MLKLGCFIIGMVLSLSLQASGIPYCTSTPIGAIAQKHEEERREQEKREQVNRLLNELAKRGKPIDITIDENIELRIKQRKKVDENINQKMSLPEAIALVAFAAFWAFSPSIFIKCLSRKGHKGKTK